MSKPQWTFVVGAALSLSACAADDSSSDEISSDALNASMVGSGQYVLIAGQSVEVEYTGSPKYVGIQTIFTSATAGNHRVTVEPLDGNGDAALWITDAAFRNLAVSRPQNKRSASLEHQFGLSFDRRYIVIRNESDAPARFKVTLGEPLHPVNDDPDEGAAPDGPTPGSAPPSGLAGKLCTGPIRLTSFEQTYDYQNQPVFASSPHDGPVSAEVKFTSASTLTLATRATYAPGRQLHGVASGTLFYTDAPTKMDWSISLAPTASGALTGSAERGSAVVEARVDAQAIHLTFSGKLSSASSGNTRTLSVSGTGKIPLSSCTP